MNLNTPLEVEVYWKNGESCQLEELGIKTEYIPETKRMTFYSVDYVSIGEPEGVGYEVGFLSSGGEEFATTLSYEDLNSKVRRSAAT